MSIKIGANLAYNGKLPNFERDSFETKAAMKAFDENSIDEGHLSYCKEDGNIYQYKHTNTVDTTTGRWRIFKTDIVVDATLNGTSTNPIQNKVVFDALRLKADATALDKYQPKYKADYVAKQDLVELPITEGVIDLNGYQLNMASVDSQGKDLTIINGTISFSVGVTIKVSTLTFNNINITGNVGEDKGIKINADSVELINVFSSVGDAFNTYLQDDTNLIQQLKIYNSNIVGSINAKEVFVYQSCISLTSNAVTHTIKLHAYNSYVLDDGYDTTNGSEWYNSYIDLFDYPNGYIDADEAHRYNPFDDTLKNDSENAPQTKAVYNALQLKADATVLGAYQPKYKADYVAKEDLSELPITKGILDLNGHSINASFSNHDGELTIQNGTILKIGKINAALNIINCTIERADVEAVNDYKVTFNYSNIKILFTDKNIYCRIFNSNVGYLACDCDTIHIYNSTVDELTCYTYGYNNVVIGNSYISIINYDPYSQPRNDGTIYLYNCVFEALDLDSYPRSIDVQLCSCCDYTNDVTFVNGHYDKTYGLRETAYATEIQNGDDIAPSADAVYNALAAYQPKYKADYVAKEDLIELPITEGVIDLNGYTLTMSDVNNADGELTIINGVIKFPPAPKPVKIIASTLTFHNITFIETTESHGKITLSVNILNLINVIGSGNGFNNTTSGDIGPNTINVYNSIIDDTISVKENIIIYNSSVRLAANNAITVYADNSTIFDDGYDYAIGSAWHNCYEELAGYISGYVDTEGYNNNASYEISLNNTETNAPQTKAVYNALQLKADKTQLNNYVTTATANSTYAKKSDITNIYKFKGTKTNYADLPTTNRVTGDVWNITNADAEHGIKAGDNVAWNGTEWDNLSGTVDLSGYATTSTTDAISKDVMTLMNKVFPFTVEVSLNKTLAKKGTSQPVTLTINAKKGDDVTSVDEININGTKYTGAIPYTHSATATTTTTYNVTVKKGSQTASKSVKITFANPSYDGAVAANFTATEANIKALTETLRSGKGGTRTFNLNNQKACIAYPKAFGAATGIKDANGFDYLASYTRSELNVNGELYYVYLMTNATTITDMKQIIS